MKPDDCGETDRRAGAAGDDTGHQMAVSELIGAIVLTTVLVAGVSIVGVVLWSQPPPQKMPSFSALVTNQSCSISLYHDGGDTLQWQSMQILVDSVDRTANFTMRGKPGATIWETGDTLVYAPPEPCALPGRVDIVYDHSYVVLSAVLRYSPLPTATATTTTTTTTTPAPVAGFSGTPLSGTAPLLVTFTDSSSNTPTSWKWEYRNATTGWTQFNTTQNPTFSFPAGTYSINLTATNAGGSGNLTRNDYFSVTTPAPVAGFSGTPLSGTAPLLVTFTDSSSNTPTSWKWEYRNATTGWTQFNTTQNPTFSFPVGIYSINLTATNAGGSGNKTSNDYITVNPSPPWYCGWSYRKNITIDKSKVPSDQTNFPVLISLTDANLKSSAKSDGYDILFTKSDGTTKIPHEIESYTSSTGALTAWVQVPSVSSSTNTTIFMYYNNSGAANQQNVNGVWDSNYKGVWHLDTVFTDSTSNGNNGTNSGTTDLSPGKLAKARNFLSSSSQYIDAGSGSSINIASTAITVEAWIKATTWRDNYWEGIIVSNSEWASSHAHGYDLRAGKSGGANGEISFNVGQGTNNVWIDALSTTAGMVTGTWYHVAGRYNGTYVEVFVNGVSLKTTANTLSMSSSPVNVNLGRSPYDVTRLFNGGIDEIRISNSARSSTWILTEYNNQNSPSTFYSVGSQEQWAC